MVGLVVLNWALPGPYEEAKQRLNFNVGLDTTGNGLRDAEIFVVASTLDCGDFIL
ncbi:MAG: hypothetical protein ACKVH0_16705 [Alphaproteobacteria bacterium]|jgi:hypothetical protein